MFSWAISLYSPSDPLTYKEGHLAKPPFPYLTRPPLQLAFISSMSDRSSLWKILIATGTPDTRSVARKSRRKEEPCNTIEALLPFSFMPHMSPAQAAPRGTGILLLSISPALAPSAAGNRKWIVYLASLPEGMTLIRQLRCEVKKETAGQPTLVWRCIGKEFGQAAYVPAWAG